MIFRNLQEVYKPNTLEVVEAPKDMVGWFQHHPYLVHDQATSWGMDRCS